MSDFTPHSLLPWCVASPQGQLMTWIYKTVSQNKPCLFTSRLSLVFCHSDRKLTWMQQVINSTNSGVSKTWVWIPGSAISQIHEPWASLCVRGIIWEMGLKQTTSTFPQMWESQTRQIKVILRGFKRWTGIVLNTGSHNGKILLLQHLFSPKPYYAKEIGFV